MRENGAAKWGEMGENGGNGGKWRKMGENGKLLQIHHGKCMKMFQQKREMEENGVEMGGKWVKNGTRAGPIFPIFPKGNLLPHRAVNKKNLVSKYPDGKMGEMEVSGGIRKTGYFLGFDRGEMLRNDPGIKCGRDLTTKTSPEGKCVELGLPAGGVHHRVPGLLSRQRQSRETRSMESTARHPADHRLSLCFCEHQLLQRPKGRDALEGGQVRPPPPLSRAPSLCPATVPVTASASFNGIQNRQ